MPDRSASEHLYLAPGASGNLASVAQYRDGLVGRGMDLEVATMQAAVKATPDLPANCWVSFNSSATPKSSFILLISARFCRYRM